MPSAGDAFIKLKLLWDSSAAQSGMDKAAGSAESFGGRFKSTFAGVLAANVVQNLASKVIDFGKQSIEAYQKSEETQTKFVDAMSRIPGASKATTQALTDQAKALSQVTVYSAGQSKQALASLASFGLTGDQLKTLLPLVQDYAAKTGKDLPSAADSVGKALLGQGRALKGVGIDFKNTGTVSGNFAEIVDGLRGHVGGLAQTMGGTTSGQMQIMQNNITALKVAVGQGLMPVIKALLPVFTALMNFIRDNSKWLVPLAVGIIGVVVAIYALNLAMTIASMNPLSLTILAVVAALAAVGVAIYLVVNNFQAIWNWIKSNWPLLLDILLGPFGFLIGWFIQNWHQIWDALLAVWGWISSAWGNILGWLAAPFVAAWQWIVGIWNAAVGWFSGLLSGIAGVFSRVFAIITAPFQSAWAWLSSTIAMVGGWFAGIPGAIGRALSGVFNAIIGPFRDAWDWVNAHVIGPIKGAWNGIAGALNAVHISIHIPDWVPVIGGKGFDWSMPHIPTLARGGLMTASGLVYAHAGEVISPAPASLNRGPAVVIENATFRDEVMLDVFMRKAAWYLQTERV